MKIIIFALLAINLLNSCMPSQKKTSGTENFASEQVRISSLCQLPPPRVRYLSVYVSDGIMCASEIQYPRCDDNRIKWSGTFSEQTCQTTTQQSNFINNSPSVSCGTIPNEGRIERVKWKSSNVPFESYCEFEKQYSTCHNGTMSDWTGSYSFDSCTKDSPLSCGATPHGGTVQKEFFESSHVPFGHFCKLEIRRKTCTNGNFTPWTGSFSNETFISDPPLDCGNIKHNKNETRTMYASSQVNAGETCQSEVQSRNCYNGEFSSWPGSYTHASCTVDGYLSCGSTPHNGVQSRVVYSTSSVPYGENCDNYSQTQTRTCLNGQFSSWSGSENFQGLTCTERLPLSCESLSHGGTETRRRYKEQYVSNLLACESETQYRSCSNGALSNWSGSFTYLNCSLSNESIKNDPTPIETGGSCGIIAQGQSEARLRWEKETVSQNESCVAEFQTRICENGQMSDWSGSFTATSCVKEGGPTVGTNPISDLECFRDYVSIFEWTNPPSSFVEDIIPTYGAKIGTMKIFNDDPPSNFPEGSFWNIAHQIKSTTSGGTKVDTFMHKKVPSDPSNILTCAFGPYTDCYTITDPKAQFPYENIGAGLQGVDGYSSFLSCSQKFIACQVTTGEMKVHFISSSDTNFSTNKPFVMKRGCYQ